MKKYLFAVVALAMLFSFSFAIGEGISIDLSALTISELNAFTAEINSELERHHAPDKKTNETVLSITKSEVESYFAEKGIAISWA